MQHNCYLLWVLADIEQDVPKALGISIACQPENPVSQSRRQSANIGSENGLAFLSPCIDIY